MLTYNGEKAKLDGNLLFTKSKKVIHISEIQESYKKAIDFIKTFPEANMDCDKLCELQEIINAYNKL